MDNGANLLIAVPGGGDGPGGVLVCSENFIIYKNQDHADVRAVIPRSATAGVVGATGVVGARVALREFFCR